MSMGRKQIGIIFGGKSVEHEVSLQSAKNIVDAIDTDKYEPVLIGIDKQGNWHVSDPTDYLLHADDPKKIQLNTSTDVITIDFGKDYQIAEDEQTNVLNNLDAIFP